MSRKQYKKSIKLTKEQMNPESSRCPKKAVTVRGPRLPQDIIRYGVSTEKAISQIEKCNIITFVCDLAANKPEIREAIEKLYGARPIRVNTAITFKGTKKAYAKFGKDMNAVDIASKANII